MGAFIIILLIPRSLSITSFFCVCLPKIRVCRSFFCFLFLGVIPPVRNRGGCGKLVALGVRLMMGRVADLSN
jgi:hypothetical protein